MAIRRAVRTTTLTRVDQTTTPWQIDLKLSQLTPTARRIANAHKKKAGPMQGIYRLQGKQLVYCLAAPGKERPTTFDTPTGSRRTLVRLERFTTGEHKIELALKRERATYRLDSIGYISYIRLYERNNPNLILPLISKLKKVRTLNVASRQLNPESFAAIGQIAGLQSLTINSDSLTDMHMKHLRRLTSLRSVSLQADQLTDEGVAHLLPARKLYNLRLTNAPVTSKVLDLLRKWPQLETVQLAGSQVTDENLTSLLDVPRLNYVDLSRTRITDQALATLAQVKKLSALALNDTAITDKGLAYLKQVKQLQTIRLARTKVTDKGVAYLVGASRMRNLNLNETRISDEGLEVIGRSFPRLYQLKIQRNPQLTDRGLMPLTGLEKLIWLYVTKGQFKRETTKFLKYRIRHLNVLQR